MSMHIVFMVSKYIIYVLSDFRDQIPLSKDDTSMHKGKDTHSDGLTELPLSGDEIDD